MAASVEIEKARALEDNARQRCCLLDLCCSASPSRPSGPLSASAHSQLLAQASEVETADVHADVSEAKLSFYESVFRAEEPATIIATADEYKITGKLGAAVDNFFHVSNRGSTLWTE